MKVNVLQMVVVFLKQAENILGSVAIDVESHVHPKLIEIRYQLISITHAIMRQAEAITEEAFAIRRLQLWTSATSHNLNYRRLVSARSLKRIDDDSVPALQFLGQLLQNPHYLGFFEVSKVLKYQWLCCCLYSCRSQVFQLHGVDIRFYPRP